VRRAALDAAFSATSLRFSAGGTTYHADERRVTFAATYERRLSSRWTLSGSIGAAAFGSLRVGSVAYDLEAGPLAAASISYRAVDDAKARPFVLFSLSLAASSASTTLRGTESGDSIVSTDARLGVTAGKTIARTVTPYLSARVFGGPIFWTFAGQDASGTDVYHYQLAAGFSLALGRVDLHVEMAPLGERDLAAGAGYAF
jgi:hypothetical protein